MSRAERRWSLGALLLLPGSVRAQAAHPAPSKLEIGEGIYLFQTAPYGDAGLDGNSVVIVTEEGVLVFDSNGTPAAAEAVLAEIRKITPAPIKYLVNSHWHWDHWYGAEVYKKAFPELQVITHERTRQLMAGPAVAFNQPGLDEQLPGHIAQLESQLLRAKVSATPVPGVAGLEAHLARDRWFLQQKRGVKHTLATITFSDSLTIHLGPRTIQVLHHDRAITPGDTYLYLPKEKVLVMGDLLINPITFALFCYPTGWIKTLKALARLDAVVLVPGHGGPLADKALLHATIALLEREQQLAREAKGRGENVDQAKATILADARVLALRTTITGSDARRNDAFALYLVDWFVTRVYQELDGTLDDSIPRTP
ncbi:MAG: MBL fold metallo-hydrolase [Cytophagaceae bacterium]|nr:MBL fold metallo-hydrolase [Gemmatimonadaceae bacterium]